mmetsp:Transcript_16759/g.23130  ORF Transcript_16759/g.23130 Transcript_16759/m.23130 type:complete len:663 (+) Transcript_16759:146-2134(+)|eukprot:CAMPEP_0196592238 /NCGR_PEP_ID=MMETSP1081-20130531/72158_1 /TAXON_ID=36882 /ORGANISM="Pyramimonas amylifera, Strain CCMP720" /LENGTH=662 /DNA_ID=CAMNT_0041915853 /DNA_START=145 /DNA_END=2133 /DNA_ORIENTATION=-
MPGHACEFSVSYDGEVDLQEEKPAMKQTKDESGMRRALYPGQTAKARNVDHLHELQSKNEEEDDDHVESMYEKFATAASISTSLKSVGDTGEGPRVKLDDKPGSPPLKLSAKDIKKKTPSVRELLGTTPAPDKTDLSLKFTKISRNLAPAVLIEKALLQEKGSHLMASGAIATLSGAKTGRSPKDKRIVRDEATEDVWWSEGSPNLPMETENFIRNRERALDYLHMLDEVFVFDGFAGWERESRVAIRVVCARAYHALFMHNMLIRPSPEELKNFVPDMTIYNAGAFPCNRYTSGMSSATSVALSLTRRELVILGTQYAGEMKKGVFTMMHYLMPKCNILSLHSGCNIGKEGDVSLFFGLSGTGKTTLSTDPERPLIGDDEHCWSSNGIFNIEGGCYAKCIDLNKDLEPEIFEAIRFGAILENVVFTKHTRQVDFSDSSVTENTRAAYPIHFIKNSRQPCTGPHPKNLILLCCDAFGVLPPVSKLTRAQAMYHFVSGYTAKVAGTEDGITEPEATFSACFGGAFLVMHPYRYATLLAQKMEQHNTTAWLVNTGWTGGRYGVGSRMKLKHTRAIIDAIHSGALNEVTCTRTPVFNLLVPEVCPGVPSDVLIPASRWADSKEFTDTLLNLGRLFQANFQKFKKGGDMISQGLVDQIMQAAPDLN